MSAQPFAPRVASPTRFPRRRALGLSPVEALSSAFEDTVQLLFRPFDGRRWIKLSVVCLFLGGGTPTAAFHWSLSSLPGEIRLSDLFLQVRQYAAQNLWLITLAIALGLSLGLALLYLRSVFRFVLVDSLVKQEVSPGAAWTAVRPLGQSYFFWLLGTLAVLGAIFSAAVVAAFPYLRSATAEGSHLLVVSLILLAILAAVTLVGLAVALLIALTDDLVVPLMYAERLSLPATWSKVWKTLRRDLGSLVAYTLLRFAVSIGVGVAVLFFLFPVLVGVFSGAIISGALVVLGLRLVGVAWVWNPLTIILALVALMVLSGLILLLLSVVGMPGQVLLQAFGMRFVASRFPSLEAVWRLSSASGGRR